MNYNVQCIAMDNILLLVIYFLLYSMDNTSVIQYLLMEGCLNYMYIREARKLRMEKGTLYLN